LKLDSEQKERSLR